MTRAIASKPKAPASARVWCDLWPVRAMKEIGVDISDRRSKSVDEFAGQSFDYVMTVCDNAKENCPFFPAASKLIDWSFDDPTEAAGSEEEQQTVFRRVRTEIREKLRELIGSIF